ncbi:MAG: gephyrin-like molybdotransferase Glp [Rhodanobacteraceae bacterium]
MADPDLPGPVSIAEAHSTIVAQCESRRLRVEPVALDGALGRVLVDDVVAPHELPPFANAAMDGYALRAADLASRGEARLRVAGVMLAGTSTPHRIAVGECVRITTGAPLPDGADTVVIKEHARLDGDHVLVPAGEPSGAHVRAAGEDYRAGQVALRRGRRLAAADLGLLASFGYDKATVSRVPSVALFSSGDELVAPDQTLGFGQIHDSNAAVLAALLRGDGIAPDRVGHLTDDPAAMRNTLRDAGDRYDVIVTCGGVSAGEADFMPRLIDEIGRVHFWKVRIRPGMPMLFGEISNALVFALPGNPVSAIVTFLALVRSGLLALQGRVEDAPRCWHARLDVPLQKSHARTEYRRARLESRDDGSLRVKPLVRQGSGMLASVVEADCLVVIPEHTHELDAGAVVEILLLPGLC